MEKPDGPRFSPGRALVGLVAVGLWAVSVFAHDFAGREIFGRFFKYAKENWGPDGRAWAERSILAGALAIAGGVLLSSVFAILKREAGRRAAPELAARWGAALLFAFAANRYLICLQSEDVHFAQYGFVAFFLALATGNPRRAFLGTVLLGFLDEAYQWWYLYYHVTDLHMDWTDVILDTCGAGLGALPFTSFQRVRRYELGREAEHDVGKRGPVVFGLAVLVMALGAFAAFLYLGQYSIWPFWFQLDNLKPHHNLTLREGIPAVLIVGYLLHAVVDERTRTLPVTAVLGLILGVHVAVSPPASPKDGSVLAVPIHARGVPHAKVPHAKGAVTIDGVVDPAEWAGALEVELRCFAPTANAEQKAMQPQCYGPDLDTKARLLWDEKALYVSFACVTTDVWARKLERDDPGIAQTPCVEVFLDPDTAERTYYEFEVSAANQVQDLFVYWPQAPQWAPNPHATSFVGLNRWSSPAFRSAVTVQGGDCEVVTDEGQATRKLPATQGYTVEMAIPWEDLRGRALWDHSANGGYGAPAPPKKGSLFRANLYRIEIRRPHGQTDTLDAYQSWAPTHAPIDFHRPHYFGVLELE